MTKTRVAGQAISTVEKSALIARCRLKEARAIFDNRGWKHLPQDQRGLLIWGADHAWLASPDNPKRGVRRWCRRWAPWLPYAELNAIVADTETSNKRWSSDQCAIVLGISLTHRTNLKLRHLGANDDPNYEARRDIERAAAAERSRRYRAKNSTGAKRGRPKSEGVKPWETLGISRRTYFRQKARSTAVADGGTKKASRHLKGIDCVTEFQCHPSATQPEKAHGGTTNHLIAKPLPSFRASRPQDGRFAALAPPLPSVAGCMFKDSMMMTEVRTARDDARVTASRKWMEEYHFASTRHLYAGFDQ